MRTTLELDERLLDEAVKLTGEKNRGRALNKALAEYIRQKRIDDLIASLGTWDLALDDWYEFRHLERF